MTNEWSRIAGGGRGRIDDYCLERRKKELRKEKGKGEGKGKGERWR